MTEEICLPQRDRRQGIRDQDRRQRRGGEWGKGYLSEEDRGLPLNRETDVEHRQMAVYEDTRGTPAP